MLRSTVVVCVRVGLSMVALCTGCHGDPVSGAVGSNGGAVNGGTAGSSGATAGRGQGGASVTTGNRQDSLPGDVMEPWEGGPAYYGAWSHGPSTDPNFFPIAVWLQAPDSTDTAKKYRDLGVNMHIGLWEGPTEVQLSAAAALGTTVIATQNAVGLQSANADRIKAWMHEDEPDNAQNNTEDPLAPETIIAGYQTMVAADKTRPVYLNLGQGVAADTWYGRGHRTNHPEDYAVYAQGADILSFDVYPMNVFPAEDSAPDWKRAFHDEVAQHIWFVATGVQRLRQWSNYEKPVWAWIETTNFNGEAGFALTPELVAAEVWMALIHGARGIGYFCHVFSPTFIEAGLLADPSMTAAVRAINAQVTALAPVLNTQSVANGVTVVITNSATAVDTMVKRHAGETFLFAVAMRPQATTATFTLRGFDVATAADKAVEVVGENRSLVAKGGAFLDDFGAHAVHIYRLGDP